MMTIERPTGSPLEYDHSTDQLTIGNVRFSPQLIEQFIAELTDRWRGPLWLRREGDQIVFSTREPDST